MAVNPSRGEVWTANFDPTRGREQAGLRPCLVISDDRLNRSRAELVIVIPITSKAKGIPSHVEIGPPEGGLTMRSFIKCEDIRSISTDRLVRLLGPVNLSTLSQVGEKLRLLLNL
ncbi:MAG: type II toxin-antitoxin system PemK/MazF family toxin [Pyrinomonadaceae bacterium]